MSYSEQPLNRVTPPGFATSPLSAGAIDVRELYEARGRLGTPRIRVVRGPDLRSRVTRFGQGIAFSAPHVFTPVPSRTTATAVVPKPPTTITLKPPTIVPITSIPTLLGPSHPPIPFAPGGPPAPPKVVIGGSQPSPVLAPSQPLTGGPSSPTTGGAPPMAFGPGLFAEGGGLTDQGYTPAPSPTGTGGGGGGGSFSAVPSPSDGSSGAASPAITLDSSTLLWLGLGALGVILVATSR